MRSIENIRIVLVEPSHPGNIGSTARAMKNMCLNDLALVNPVDFPSDHATAMASGSDDILQAATIHDSMVDAVKDCGIVIGTSARTRRVPWPLLSPKEAVNLAVANKATEKVALVFGRERVGLMNEELEKCQYLVHIPTNPEYSSLNLSQAVQVIAYELMVAAQAGETPEPRDEGVPLATGEQVAGFMEHLQSVLADVEFLDPNQPKTLMRRLHRMFNRIQMDRNEINIMRGILAAVEKKTK